MKRPVAGAFAMTSLLELEPMADDCAVILEEKLDEMQGCPFDLGVWLQWYAFDVISSITFSNRFDFLKRGEDVAGVIQAIESRLFYNAIVGQIPWLHPYIVGLTNLMGPLASIIPAVSRLGAARYLAEFARKQVNRYSADDSQKQYQDMLSRFKRKREGKESMKDVELLSHATSNMYVETRSFPVPSALC